jgi:adenylate kinase family enzyme
MILFINGSINAGKTTVAKILAKKIPNAALVEIDVLREMIAQVPIEEAVPIVLENAVSVIKSFLEKGLNVIVPYPFSQKNHDYLMENLKDLDTKIYFFTLAPKIERALENKGIRELNDWEKKRIKYHYSIGMNNPSFGEIIDNTDQAPEETADYIVSKV